MNFEAEDMNYTKKNLESSNTSNEYFWKKPINRMLLIILFALVTGHAWHIRGSGPWGGSTGMWAVGSMMIFLMVIFFGDRAQATSTWIGILVLLLSLTTSGWGTLNRQITGRLQGPSYDIAVNPWSGAFYVFIIGFGWAPLFAFGIGIYFNKNPISFRKIVGGIVIFYIAMIFSRLVISHLVIPFTANDAFNLFETAIMDTGQTPWEFYLKHFFDQDLLYSIPGGRNYEAMVTNFADAFGAIFVWIYARFGLKERKIAHYTLLIPIVLGSAILIADLWMFWDAGCLYDVLTETYSCNAPDWLQGIGWGMWEYSTGFLFGLGFAILITSESTIEYKDSANTQIDFPKNLEKPLQLGFIGIILFAAIWFPVGSLIERWGYTPENYIVIGMMGLLYFIVTILYWKGKIQYPKHSKQQDAFYLLLFYWILFFTIDQILTPRTTSDWRHVSDYLDIISILIGIPLLLILYKAQKK